MKPASRLLSALVVLASPSFGQQALPPAVATEAPVELSPFLVDASKDVGYVSTPDPSISLAYSDGVRIENVRSLAAPGMTLNVRGGAGLVVRGLMIERTGDRLVAGNSDGIHVKCGAAQPLIQDCRIEGTMDDSIHVKISGDWIMEVASLRRVRIQHMDIAHDNTFNLSPGVPAIQVTNSRGVALRDNRFYGRERPPATSEVIKLTNSPLREDHANRFLRMGER